MVKLSADAVNSLSSELEKIGILLPPEIILDNLMETWADVPINAIHGTSGFKAELFPLREGDELCASAFARRRKVDFGPGIGEVFVHAPEDLILYKLICYALSRQTKHIRDIGSMLKVLGEEIDEAYLDKWVEAKGLHPIWEEIKSNL